MYAELQELAFHILGGHAAAMANQAQVPLLRVRQQTGWAWGRMGAVAILTPVFCHSGVGRIFPWIGASAAPGRGRCCVRGDAPSPGLVAGRAKSAEATVDAEELAVWIVVRVMARGALELFCIVQTDA
jgi:hypothetical protein